MQLLHCVAESGRGEAADGGAPGSRGELCTACCDLLLCSPLPIYLFQPVSLSFVKTGGKSQCSISIFVQFPNIPSAFPAASCSASQQPSVLSGHGACGQDPHPWPLGKHLWDLILCISHSLLQDLSGTSPLDGAHHPEMSVY